MAAGGATKPESAVMTAMLQQTLMFFAFGALAHLLAMGDVRLEQKSAFDTLLGVVTAHRFTAIGVGTGQHGFTGVTPVFALQGFFAHGAFLHQINLK